MSNQHSISICIPVYNEEETIKQVIEEAFTVVNSLTSDYEVIVVDDGSTDQTKAILGKAVTRYDKLIVLNHEKNLGKEPAFKTLFKHASKEYIFSIDADRQFPMESLCQMYEKLKEGYDIVMGVKRNIKQVYNPYRLLISFFYNFSIHLLFSVRIRDAGGIKLSRSIICKMPIYSKSVFADAERIIRAHYAGCSIGTVDIDIRPRLYGKAKASNLQAILASIKDLLKIFIMKKKVVNECKSLTLSKE